MTAEIASVKNNLVVRDDVLTWRWYDAFGPNVVKTIVNPTQSGVVSTTTMAGTIVTVSTAGTLVSVDSEDGGALAWTPSGTEDQGLQTQWGEGFYLGRKWPAYFGIRFKNVDVDQADWIAGLCINDTTLLGGLSDGLYFRSVDASAALTFVLEKDSAETETNVATLADATYVTAEWVYDGDYVYAYIDGALAATVAATNANFPSDEHLAAAVALLTGEATANTLSVAWMRAIQVQAA
mgnify:CR=1 FL=1